MDGRLKWKFFPESQKWLKESGSLADDSCSASTVWTESDDYGESASNPAEFN
jgi:hypothetical protein